MTSVVENIGLEALMDRANIIFTNGYVFDGVPDIAQLSRSFEAVVGSVRKFRFQLKYVSQSDFHWYKSNDFKTLFHHQISTDIEETFKVLSSRSIGLIGNSPILMTVIENKQHAQFMIAVSSNHTYMDARSANYIFNHIIKHYNASLNNEDKLIDSTLNHIMSLRTISGSTFAEQAISGRSEINNTVNIDGLLEYTTEDVGRYGIARSELTQCLKNYKKSIHEPLISQLDINHCISACRKDHPQITKNSVVCAMLVKAVYLVNVEQRAKPQQHQVSFKMLSDLLTVDKRKQYTGNYISFLPVTVDAEKSLSEIALQIHNRIVEFKTSGIDISMFSLTEQAIKQELVGTNDETLSFVVTNWNNFDYLASTNFLHNCKSTKHLSAVNIEPKDNLGAALVNRPVAVINFSPNTELCLSFFPSLKCPQENRDLLTKFKTLLHPKN